MYRPSKVNDLPVPSGGESLAGEGELSRRRLALPKAGQEQLAGACFNKAGLTHLGLPQALGLPSGYVKNMMRKLLEMLKEQKNEF